MPLYKTASGLAVSTRRGAAASATSREFVRDANVVKYSWGVRAVLGAVAFSCIGNGVCGRDKVCEA